MPNFRILFLLLVFLVSPLAFGILAKAALPPQGHLLDKSCSECHLAQQVTPENAKMLVARQEKLCLDCHPKALQTSHPSGIFPKSIIPADFPLDWKGEMTCSSCHTPHGREPGLMRSSQRGMKFCQSCHEAKFFDRMPDRGASLVRSGHLNPTQTNRTSVLDAVTLECLSCHEELGDTNKVGLEMSGMGGGIMRHFGSSTNHPIGTVYEKVSKTRNSGYRNVHMLPPEIALPDGKISCVSCHKSYAEKHGVLVMSNEGSNLCLTCHDL
ncbi:MAG: cytochrome c3 family protein [Magnetococcus sp. DMHC-1]|nr:cytochrome c3 family protein [Magnetococcales bacterium]